MKDGKDTVGVVLGYSRKQFLQAELPGAVNMLRATPFSHWPFLIGTAGKALANYVPPPADDAYYINNIAGAGRWQDPRGIATIRRSRM